MSPLVLGAIVLPSWAAYLSLSRRWGANQVALGRWLAASMAPGIGVGVASCVYFLLLAAAGTAARAVVLDALFWALMIALLLITRHRPVQRGAVIATDRLDCRSDIRTTTNRTAVVFAAVALAAMSGLAAASFWFQWRTEPHGQWDAWAVWNLHARAILRAAPDWTAILSSDLAWSSPDYPLLVPISVARLWAYVGSESTAVPPLVAALFFSASIATLTIAIGQSCGWTAGLLSGAILIVPRTFVFQSGCQCADTPVAFFALVAVALIVMAGDALETRGALVATAGLASGLTAWTKNEGQLLVVAMIGLLLILPRRFGLRAVLLFAAGAAVPLSVVAWFKWRLAPPGLLGPQAVPGLLTRFTDEARWATLLDRTTQLLATWGGTQIAVFLVLAIVVALVARPTPPRWRRAAEGLFLAAALMAGYLITYVIAPTSLDTMAWHIATSFDRLVTQIWPAVVWSLFQLSGELEQSAAQGLVFGD